MSDCTVCADKGFVRMGDDVEPCPGCNPDSGYAADCLCQLYQEVMAAMLIVQAMEKK
jgi:hypothetical protein